MHTAHLQIVVVCPSRRVLLEQSVQIRVQPVAPHTCACSIPFLFSRILGSLQGTASCLNAGILQKSLPWLCDSL